MRIASVLAFVASLGACSPTPSGVNEQLLKHYGSSGSVIACNTAPVKTDCLQHEVDILASLRPAYIIYNLGVKDAKNNRTHSVEELQAIMRKAYEENFSKMKENTPKGRKAPALRSWDTELMVSKQDIGRLLERAQDIYSAGFRNRSSNIFLSPAELEALIKKFITAREIIYSFR